MSEFDPVWFDAVGMDLLALLKKANVPEYAMPECGSKILSEMRRWVDNRNVNHFSHEYLIAIRRLPSEWGGGYMACIPQLGTACFHGEGETPEEALNNLQCLYDELWERWKDDPDIGWAEPKTEDCIVWRDVKQKTPDEVYAEFSNYLAQADKKLLTETDSE